MSSFAYELLKSHTPPSGIPPAHETDVSDAITEAKVTNAYDMGGQPPGGTVNKSSFTLTNGLTTAAVIIVLLILSHYLLRESKKEGK